ncbi:SUKH-4 family immunity protein [Streptomyces sp. Pv4-95]|uniref:SUKH-4 family immunity protein n=1 Tax=Streptomyces sp. Pv4-95 TaxID=3049543 RepID=UPI003891D6DB
MLRRRGRLPLTAERVDAAFAPYDVRRIAAEQLPGALEHPASRRHLRDIGLPLGWVCGWESIDLLPADALPTPEGDALQGVRLPQGTQVADLLSLGTSDHGDLFLHRRDGTVFIALAAQGQDGHGWEAIELAPDLDVFTRYLEGIRRYTNACWYPYPNEENAAEVFTAEMDALAPGFFDYYIHCDDRAPCLGDRLLSDTEAPQELADPENEESSPACRPDAVLSHVS